MGKARSLIGVAAAIALLACTGAASAGGSGWTIRFTFVPEPGVPGAAGLGLRQRQTAGDDVPDRSPLRRRLAAAGLGTVRTSSGRASWKSISPRRRRRGRPRAGRLRPPRQRDADDHCRRQHRQALQLTIGAKGFTQQRDRFGSGSSVSYGVVLRNPSTSEDAEDVTVLVNFVDGDNHVVQSATTRVSGIAAASTFNLGGSATLAVQTPVTKLEVVVQTGSFVARSLHIPAAQNLEIVGSQLDPGWVGEVDGEVVNDDATKVLSSAQLSVVLYDASGSVVGGGTGFLLESLPPGTRAYFSANAGLNDVPLDQASVAAISIEPTYTSP